MCACVFTESVTIVLQGPKNYRAKYNTSEKGGSP